LKLLQEGLEAIKAFPISPAEAHTLVSADWLADELKANERRAREVSNSLELAPIADRRARIEEELRETTPELNGDLSALKSSVEFSLERWKSDQDQFYDRLQHRGMILEELLERKDEVTWSNTAALHKELDEEDSEAQTGVLGLELLTTAADGKVEVPGAFDVPLEQGKALAAAEQAINRGDAALEYFPKECVAVVLVIALHWTASQPSPPFLPAFLSHRNNARCSNRVRSSLSACRYRGKKVRTTKTNQWVDEKDESELSCEIQAGVSAL
jgi:hypothetical protein